MGHYRQTFTPDPADTRSLRNALGRFPTGVVIVTATVAGERIGMTMSSFNALSLDPALILFSIGRHAHSLPLFEKAESYAIHVLSQDQTDLSNRFARAGADKFAGVETTPGLNGAPHITGAQAIFDCVPNAIHDAGDHRLFVAQVSEIHLAEPSYPLIFSQGGYVELR
ncbi:flavin reductase family protein [Thioclava sp. GXIMD2076]|uniref:flavin reductase family protein n=1 Tax=Thioclava sp. GXIMD2076 TaxID=3131931 RepID=UPI0030CBAF3B